MRLFKKTFWGGFAGEMAATIFLLFCAALGFGPDVWVRFMTDNLPWLPTAIAQFIFILLGLLTFVNFVGGWHDPKVSPNMDMADAIDRVMDSLFPDRDPRHLNYRDEVLLACNAILEKLRSGGLSSWGIRIENGIHLNDKIQSFHKNEWNYRELIPLSAHIPRIDKAQTRTPMKNQYPIQLTGLKVNSNQVKKLWPVENT